LATTLRSRAGVALARASSRGRWSPSSATPAPRRRSPPPRLRCGAGGHDRTLGEQPGADRQRLAPRLPHLRARRPAGPRSPPSTSPASTGPTGSRSSSPRHLQPRAGDGDEAAAERARRRGGGLRGRRPGRADWAALASGSRGRCRRDLRPMHSSDAGLLIRSVSGGDAPSRWSAGMR
jgi:hypothetical protein